MDWVNCSFCGKKYFKDTRHINENLKLGYNFFCSPVCQHSFKNKQIEFICENKDCKKKFKRAPHNTSPHNYCSRSCAAIVNNIRKIRNKMGINGLYRIKVRKVLTEKERRAKKLAGSRLGGKNRWLNYQSKYTKEFIIGEIRSFVTRNGRLPVKKEMQRLCSRARERFGTWNNAIEAAGFDPNPVLFAKHQIANDGHLCDSLAEKVIDDYLFEKGITHERNISYPEGVYTADFKIGDKLIEYFGLAGEHKRYDELRLIKQKLIKKFSLKLIEVYPKDLYPRNHLDEILGYCLSS